MPTVAMFDGSKIQMFNDEHPPPHFHAVYAEHRASILIATLEIVEGHLPRPQLRKAVDWAEPRRPALLAAWELSLADMNPGKIK